MPFHRVMLFIVGLPVVQILLFCYAIGHDPTGIKLAVANHEMSEEMIMQQLCPVHTGCNQTMLSCRYIDMLVKNKSMVVVSAMQINYSSYHPFHSISIPARSYHPLGTRSNSCSGNSQPGGAISAVIGFLVKLCSANYTITTHVAYSDPIPIRRPS